MSWGKHPLAAAAMAMAAAVLAASAAEAGVIVKASGPSAARYPVGKQLADSDTIVLREGDSVTVLTDAGTRVIRGPGTHRVGARGASKKTTFAMLTRRDAGAQVRTGAVRDPATGNARNDNLWAVDVTRAGRMCLAPGAGHTLWRPDPAAEAVYVLKSAQSDFHIHVTFAAGEATAALAADKLPLTPDGGYVLTGPGGAGQAVEFVALEQAPDTAEALATLLAEKGCTAQLDLMTTALAAG